jgi:hypothetical protein
MNRINLFDGHNSGCRPHQPASYYVKVGSIFSPESWERHLVPLRQVQPPSEMRTLEVWPLISLGLSFVKTITSSMEKAYFMRPIDRDTTGNVSVLLWPAVN